MKIRVAVLVAALAAVATLAVAGTPNVKTYTVDVTTTLTLHQNQMAPGTYKLALGTASVKITEAKTGKLIEVPAKIETNDKKFAVTAIITETVNGTTEIREIQLAGNKIRINFR